MNVVGTISAFSTFSLVPSAITIIGVEPGDLSQIRNNEMMIFHYEPTEEIVFAVRNSAGDVRFSRLPTNMGPPIGFLPCVIPETTLSVLTVPTLLQNLLALRPIRGVNYQPSPSDYVSLPAPPQYFDTDFWNSDFEGLWGTNLVPGGASPCTSTGGRDDLKTLHEDLNTNLLRGFNLSLQFRNHVPFLDACQAVNIKVLLPLDTWVTQVSAPNWTSFLEPLVKNIVKKLGNHPAVAGWTLGNELNGSLEAKNIATMFQLLVNHDPGKRPTTSPHQIGFFPSMAQMIKDAIVTLGGDTLEKEYEDRWLQSMNIYPDQADIVTDPLKNLKQIILTDWPQSAFANQPFLVTEYGVAEDTGLTEADQATSIMLQAQWIQNLANGGEAKTFLGGCVFEWSNEAWKLTVAPPQGLLGLNKFTVAPPPPPPGGFCTATESNGNIYRVDTLVQKPSFASYKSVVNP